MFILPDIPVSLPPPSMGERGRTEMASNRKVSIAKRCKKCMLHWHMVFSGFSLVLGPIHDCYNDAIVVNWQQWADMRFWVTDRVIQCCMRIFKKLQEGTAVATGLWKKTDVVQSVVYPSCEDSEHWREYLPHGIKFTEADKENWEMRRYSDIPRTVVPLLMLHPELQNNIGQFPPPEPSEELESTNENNELVIYVPEEIYFELYTSDVDDELE